MGPGCCRPCEASVSTGLADGESASLICRPLPVVRRSIQRVATLELQGRWRPERRPACRRPTMILRWSALVLLSIVA